METDKKSFGGVILAEPRFALSSVAAAAAVSCPFFAASGLLPVWRGLIFTLLIFLPAAEDFRTGYISDVYSLALGAAGICCSVWEGNGGGLWSAGVVFLFFLFLRRWRPDAVGAGDVGLSVAVSLWLPGAAAFLFVWLSFFFGSLFGIFLLLRKRKTLSDGLPFGPFLALGGAATYVFGEEAVRWYEMFL